MTRLVSGVHRAEPGEEALEIGIVQTGTATHEEQGVRHRQRLDDRPRMGIAFDPVIGSDPQNDRLRLLPVAVQVENARLLAAQEAEYVGLILPGDGAARSRLRATRQLWHERH
jgi:hypothetical protein